MFKSICEGCKEELKPGELIWISDLGEETILTHPKPECLVKVIDPEEGQFLSSR